MRPAGPGLTMTPGGIRPGTRIVRPGQQIRSPGTLPPQAVKVVGAPGGSQPQIISIAGGQGKTVISGQSTVKIHISLDLLQSFNITRPVSENV